MEEENSDTPIEPGEPGVAFELTERHLERAAREILASNEGLRKSLDAYDAVIRESLEKYGAGMRLRDVVRMLSPADATVGSNVDVIRVFEARRAFRRVLIGALLIDGMAVDEIAKTFDVPIGTVSAVANELGKPID